MSGATITRSDGGKKNPFAFEIILANGNGNHVVSYLIIYSPNLNYLKACMYSNMHKMHGVNLQFFTSNADELNSWLSALGGEGAVDNYIFNF